MIAKKIVLPLLFALAFFISFIPGRDVVAYSFPDDSLEITDTVKEKMWTRIFTQAQAGEPYYLICYYRDGLPYVHTFSSMPAFSGYVKDGSNAQLVLSVPCRSYYTEHGTSTYSTWSSWGVDISTGLWDVKEDCGVFDSNTNFVKYNLWFSSPPPEVTEEDGSTRVVVSSDIVRAGIEQTPRFMYSNFSCDFFDGKTVFVRAPLVLDSSLTRKTTLGAQVLETEPGKVGTVTVMVAVSGVLLFPFLATFLKRSLHSLLGLPVGSRHGLRK